MIAPALRPFSSPDFIDFLRPFRLQPERFVRVGEVDGQLDIDVAGPWPLTILFETPTLAIVSEGLGTPLTFADYPQSADWLLGRRDAINQAIAQAIAARP